MGGACSKYGGEDKRIQGLVWKPEGKRLLGRRRSRWEDNIKTDLQEVGCGNMDWIELAEDRDRWRTLVNTLMAFGFHKMQGISRLAANRLASPKGLCSME